MNRAQRILLWQLLNIQWEIFSNVAPGHEELIALYIEAKDRAHQLLSQLAKAEIKIRKNRKEDRAVVEFKDTGNQEMDEIPILLREIEEPLEPFEIEG